jgi:ElaB/YqjD/DUF883 family membrane-anchored ribosome-binding protein
MGIKDQASDVAARAQDWAAESGRSAEAKINETRESAAAAIDSAAGALHQAAKNLPVGKRVSSAAHTAADKLGSTADYLGDHDARDMISGLGRLVKSYPGRSLIAAAGLGFLVGRALRRG